MDEAIMRELEEFEEMKRPECGDLCFHCADCEKKIKDFLSLAVCRAWSEGRRDLAAGMEEDEGKFCGGKLCMGTHLKCVGWNAAVREVRGRAEKDQAGG